MAADDLLHRVELRAAHNRSDRARPVDMGRPEDYTYGDEARLVRR